MYEFEKNFWGNCANTFDEEQKHYIYAKCMAIQIDGYSFNVHNKSILDIGGGPVSMLLKCINLKKGKIIDPIVYPQWTRGRYQSLNICVDIIRGEDIVESGWDEVWIYNCLQHTIDPKKIIENAKRSAKILRIFEWLNIPIDDGHFHILTKNKLDDWISNTNSTIVDLAQNGCYGTAYCGVFKL